MSRREYCAKHGIAITTLDYWRRVHREQDPVLIPVTIEGTQAAGFTLILTNGRRIESSWSFEAAALEKLIRMAS
jgi:hypothetical protein